MAEEYFYGVTLSETEKSVTWDHHEGKEEFPRTHKLIIKQILLGHNAKENEYNVVEAETRSIRDKIKIPIAVLKSGETRHCRLELDFPDSPVTFKLIEGSGPVYIVGQHLVEEFGDMEEIEEEYMDEEEMDNEVEETDEETAKKKIKLSNNGKGKSNVKNKKK